MAGEKKFGPITKVIGDDRAYQKARRYWAGIESLQKVKIALKDGHLVRTTFSADVLNKDPILRQTDRGQTSHQVQVQNYERIDRDNSVEFHEDMVDVQVAMIDAQIGTLNKAIQDLGFDPK